MQTLNEFRATSAHFSADEMESLRNLVPANLVGTEVAASAVPHLYACQISAHTQIVVIIETNRRFEWGWHQGGTDWSPSLAQAEADLHAERQEFAA